MKSKENTAPSRAVESGDDPKSGVGQRLRSRAGQSSESRARQRKMLKKLYSVLVKTPDDGKGRVPETPFTVAGVAKLMQMLKGKTSDPNAPGAKVANSILRNLSAQGDDEAVAGGASVKRLQTFARQAERMQGKRGKGKTGD